MVRCSKNLREVRDKDTRNIKMSSKNFLLVVKSLDEIMAIPCVSNTMKKI